jgi:hypothetical protein
MASSSVQDRDDDDVPPPVRLKKSISGSDISISSSEYEPSDSDSEKKRAKKRQLYDRSSLAKSKLPQPEFGGVASAREYHDTDHEPSLHNPLLARMELSAEIRAPSRTSSQAAVKPSSRICLLL